MQINKLLDRLIYRYFRHMCSKDVRVKCLWVLLVAMLISSSAGAQLTIDNSRTPEELVREVLLGRGVEIFNITYTGDMRQFGSYSVEGSNLQISEGMMMTTGGTEFANTLTDAAGELGGEINDRTNVDDMVFMGPGDSDLSTISGQQTADAAVIEFDFIPSDNLLEFRYVFGSEEYPEFVCGGFNDVFAFIISGPGFKASTNIALIPGTPTPVAINTVNPGQPGEGLFASGCSGARGSLDHSEFYIDNVGGSWVEYDGMTVVLTAVAEVEPCQTYHIKIAIADAVDSQFDSGVFLEANSFNSEAFTFEIDSPTDSTRIVEGCGTATVDIQLVEPTSEALNLNFEIAGSAIEGVDYSELPDELIIPAGDSVVSFDIEAFSDEEVEGIDTVLFLVQSGTCGNFDTLVITIGDPGTMALEMDQGAICNGVATSFALNAQVVEGDAVGKYIWTPPGGLDDPSSAQPILNTDTIGEWIVTFEQGTCIQRDTFRIFGDRDVSLIADTSFAKCNAVDIDLDPFESGVNDGLSYEITDDEGMEFCSDCPLATFSDVEDGIYKVVGTNVFGCQDSLNVSITIEPQIAISNLECVNVTHSSFELVWDTNVAVDEYEVILDNGSTQTFQGNESFVFDGYTPGAGQMIEVQVVGQPAASAICPPSMIAEVTCQLLSCEIYDLQIPQDTVSCNEAPITLTANQPFESYTWSNGVSTSTDPEFTIDESGLVQLIVQDEFGCATAVEQEFFIVDSIHTTITKNDISCTGLNDGEVSLSIEGGVPVYDITWSNGATSTNLGDLGQGSFVVEINDDIGCSATDSITINEPQALSLLVDLTDPQGFTNRVIEGCSDSEITVDIGDPQIDDVDLLLRVSGTAEEGVDYSELPEALTVVGGDSTATFRLAPFKDAADEGVELIIIEARRSTCEIWDTLEMEINDEGFLELVQDELEICLGDELAFQAEAVIPRGEIAGDFLWTPSEGLSADDIADPIIQINGMTVEYNVRFQQDQCIQNGLFQVTANHEIELKTDESLIKCDILDLVFDPFESGDDVGITYTVMDPVSTDVLCASCPDILLSDEISSGSYQIEASNAFGCSSSTSFDVAIEEQIRLTDLNCQNETHSGFEIALDASNAVEQYGVIVEGRDEVLIPSDQIISIADLPTGGGEQIDVEIIAYPFIDAICPPSTIARITCELLPCTDYDIAFTEDLTSCDEVPISLTTTREFESYDWSLGTKRGVNTKDFIADQSGTLSVRVIDEFGCEDGHSDLVNIVDSVLISAQIRNLGCSGDDDGEVALDVSGGNSNVYQYTWSNGMTSSTIRNIASGIYDVTITDDIGCAQTGAYEVTAPEAIAVDLILDQPTCNGYADGQIEINASGGSGVFLYALDGGVLNDVPSLTDLPSQEYTVSIFDDQDCRLDTTIFLAQPALLMITDDTYLELAYGESLQFDINTVNQQGDLEYIWSGPSSNEFSCLDCPDPTILALASANYVVTVIDDAGCTAEHLFQITVTSDRSFLVPTGFTPNGDNRNDRLRVHGVENLSVESFRVYARDGALVYRRDGFVLDNFSEDGWDGMIKNKLAPSGIYLWYAEVTFQDGVTEKFQGTTELIR